MESGRKLSSGNELRFRISTTVNDPAEMEYAMGEATGLMRSIRQDGIGREESFEIQKSDSMAQSLNEITGYLRIGGFIIGFITLIGASIGLMNIMMVSVTERTREIGVRKALGATPLRIRQQFLIEAIVICLIGGIAGVVLGILIGNVIAHLIDAGTFIIPWIWVISGLLICILVGLISGYLPARKASKLDPIESLRFE
jgi:putative ABC transport system permease protein